ncbi:hypothetical protein AWB74_06070 [Caballeronia arvi]|uniref:Uncharacterized protein n=1 Tax=Caballeronia arvi TaxID=1777135 RepID=A0A158KM94_9BURK|nr:hypothetical protein [Caballeronia arvi]SAL81843.1 hypothetical protein AWB74_06070 [Caballeronia arvi]
MACKEEAGSAYLVNELVRLVYLTFNIQDATYGDTDLGVYAHAGAPLFEAILRQADRQFDGASSYVHMDASARA